MHLAHVADRAAPSPGCGGADRSMRFFSLSMSISSRSNPLSAYRQSTSQSATMFWLERLIRLVRPMPPTPTPAMFSVSLGGVNPRPRTCLGTIAHAAPPAATSVRNTRREISFFLLISIFSKDSLSRIGEGDIRPERDHAEAGRDTLATVETHTALKFALKRSGKGDYEKIGGGIEQHG